MIKRSEKNVKRSGMIVRTYYLYYGSELYTAILSIRYNKDFRINLNIRNNNTSENYGSDDWSSDIHSVWTLIDDRNFINKHVVDALMSYLMCEHRWLISRYNNTCRINFNFDVEEYGDMVKLRYIKRKHHRYTRGFEYWIYHSDNQNTFVLLLIVEYNLISESNASSINDGKGEDISYYLKKYDLYRAGKIIETDYRAYDILPIIIHKIVTHYYPIILKNIQELEYFPDPLTKLISQYCYCRIN
jgi:hypothetical protein